MASRAPLSLDLESAGFHFLAICLVLPVWLAKLPPMTDLPQHAAQVTLLMQILSGGGAMSSDYQIRWFTPYLVPYLFTALLATFVGVISACKIVVSVALVGLPLLARRLVLISGGPPVLSWPVVLCAYGFSYQWGFLSFMLASAIVLYTLPMVWGYAATGGARQGGKLATMVALLFFSHALAFGFFVLLCGASILASNRGRFLPLVAHLRLYWPLIPAIPLSVAWILSSSTHSSVAHPPVWDLGWMQTSEAYYNIAEWLRVDHLGFGRLAGLFVRVFGFRDPLLSFLVGLVVMAWPFAMGMKIRRPGVYSVPFFLTVVILFFAPSFLFGTAFVFQRFALFFLPFYMLLFQRGGRRCGASWALPVVFVFWLVWVWQSHMSFRKGVLEFEEVSAAASAGGRALALVFDREDDYSIAPTWIHFPVWQMARAKTDVSPNFAATHIQLVTYKASLEPKESINSRFEWRPRSILREPVEAGRYDYFFVRSSVERTDFVQAGGGKDVKLMAKSGSWWLYRSGNH